MNSQDFQWLLQTPTQKQWTRIGTEKCSGVVVPLFSVYSSQSIGIGEFPDLKMVVDWCDSAGIKLLQLLPLNDVGFNFMPYDAQSMFALDPMYLKLEAIQAIDQPTFQPAIDALRRETGTPKGRVDYAIKGKKLKILWDMYSSVEFAKNKDFQAYCTANAVWLDDYALFRSLKEKQDQRYWLHWDEPFRHKLTNESQAIKQEMAGTFEFNQWLQWQAYLQLKDVKAYANSKKVYIMGDLPFLVSRDSADVWSNQHYFKMDLAAGAPPDLYFANGQRWGMPPYNWDTIAENNYDYLIRKLNYAEHFYDLYRIDHFVGVFRLWSIPMNVPDEESGEKGFFDPRDEMLWEEHGKRLLDVMIQNTMMLPCAEDLGTVPDCSYKVVKEYGIVGTDVQRWIREWKTNCDFKQPEKYRPNGIAAIATHDLPVLQDWWENEMATVDEALFRKKCEGRGFDVDWLIGQLFETEKAGSGRLRWRPEIDSVDTLLGIMYRRAEEVQDFIEMFHTFRYEKKKFLAFVGIEDETIEHFSIDLARKILEKTNECASIFSIQMLQDWLTLSVLFKGCDPMDLRINKPGSVHESNWSVVFPFDLETLLNDPSYQLIRVINETTGRI